MPNQETVLLVDDHPFVREGMAKVLQMDGRYKVCAEAGTAQEAIDGVREHRPDYVIVDMSLEQGTGLDVLEYIREHALTCLPVVVSMYEEPVYIDNALQAGARGYIFKRESVDSVVLALEEVKRGRLYMSPRVTQILLECKKRNHEGDVKELLSEREYKVFELLGEGLRRNQIAEALFISAHTVDSHVDRIKSKLNCPSTAHLIRCAIQSQLKP